jgi:Xaa-Pro aminopeptidase
LNNEFARRRRLVAAELATRKLDAFLVSSSASVRYLTGFTGSSGVLLMLPGDAVLFTDPRYAVQSGREVSCQTKISRGPLLPGVAASLQRRRIRRLGFERAHLSYDGFDVLRARLPVNTALEPVAGWVEAHRMLKSQSEIELIERSVAANSEAFERAARRVRPGMLEQDLAAEIEYRMRRLGAQKPSFETIVAAGERSALPHAHPTGAALDAVRPGVTSGHVDRQARNVLKAYKLDLAFVHSTGHGLGLEIHEMPRIGRKDKTPLQAGMAITIEPGVYLEGFGGIRIEDTVVVTQTGCRVLTPTSKELRVI